MQGTRNRTRFNPAPTVEYDSLVGRLAQLGQHGASSVYADVAHNKGEHFARGRGLTPGKLSTHNVGRLLAGIPDRLRAETEPEHSEHIDLTTAWGKSIHNEVWHESATQARRSIVEWIANCNGWMDHGQLFLRAGRPHAIVGHPYSLRTDHLAKLLWVADLWGLHAFIDSASWYYPGQTVRVELSVPPDKQAADGQPSGPRNSRRGVAAPVAARVQPTNQTRASTR